MEQHDQIKIKKTSQPQTQNRDLLGASQLAALFLAPAQGTFGPQASGTRSKQPRHPQPVGHPPQQQRNWPSVSTQSLLRIFAANADPHLGQGCKLPAGALAVFVRVPDWAGTDDEKFEANDCDILGHVSSCK